MKIMKKALALLMALIMVLGVVPAYADGLNNGTTIDLSVIFSSDNKGANPITSVEAGQKFYMIVTFDGNPTDETGIVGYTLCFGYNPDKITINRKLNSLTSPTFNGSFAEGVFLGTWGSLDGILEDDEYASNGILFRVEGIAKEALTKDDLANIELLASATGAETQETAMLDVDKKAFTINWVPTIAKEEAPQLTEIKESDFTFDLAEKEYTGSAIEPAVSSATLTAGTDYDVAYTNNTEVGTATITVTGKGKYTGTITKNFVIKAKEVAGDNTNGTTIDLSVIFSSDNKGANPITSVEAGQKFYMIVTFDGNPTDETGIVGYTLCFGYNPDKITINRKLNSLTSPTFNGSFAEGVFLGTWGSLDGILEDDEYASNGILFRVEGIAKEALTKDDLANIELLASATGAETQETAMLDVDKKAFTINWVPTIAKEEVPTVTEIKESDFTFDLADKEYTGSEIKPTVTSTLAADAYDVTYSNNTGVGTATITVTGKGNYTGTVVKNFNIIEKAIADSNFTFDLADKEYTGSAIEPVVTSALTAGTDYEVAYANNTNVGTATITVTGKGAYSGTVTKTFEIKAKAIADTDFTFDLADVAYTGEEIKPEVKSTLKEGTDFDVVYSNNTEVGTATITVTGKGNYKGEVVKNFEIIDPSTLDDIVLSIAFTEAKENGEKITSVVSGEKFWMWVNFANNPTELEKTAIGYDLLIAYNNDKIKLGECSGGLTTPATFKGDFAEGIAFAQWADTDGIKSGKSIQSEGTLFMIEATAKEVLSSRDLRDIIVIDQASAQAGGVTRYKETAFYNIDYKRIDYIFEATIDGGAEIKESDFTIDLADKEYTGYEIIPEVSSEKLVKDKDYIVIYDYNIEAGPATITIKGIGDYVGTIQRTFKINPKPITESKFTIDTSTRTYTGTKFEPSVSSSLPSDAYEVSYANNIEVGTATITVTGKGNYTGTVIKSFTILARAISDADFEFDLADKEYTGKEIKPEVKTALIEGIDYDVTYSNNVEVGTATISVGAKGNYSGLITKTFKIVPRAIQEYDFKFDLENKVYTGSAITPEVKAETGLVEGTDYDVAYANNVEFGKATITVTGKGNYTGTVVKNFNIVARAIEEADFTFDLADKEYTGEEIKPEVTSTLADTDYDVAYYTNIEKGIATIIVTGKGNYSGTVTKTFNVITRTLKDGDFKFDLVNKVYTGAEITPVVTSTFKAEDYTVTYENNLNVGTAKIIVTGSGENCAGTISREFEIVAKTITEDDFVFDLSDEEYTSKAIEGKVTSTLTENDYVVTYENNVNVGTATIIVVGKDNYAGRIEKAFNITTRALTDADFTFDLSDKEYTGSAIEPEVTSTLADGDFEVVYTENVNAGTATITVKGIGNCTGEIVKTFTILPRMLANTDFTFDSANKVATGEAIEPEVLSELVAGTDYEVTYENNVEEGTATITVTGKGNCEGTVTATFNIVGTPIKEEFFTFDLTDKEYTGSGIEPTVTSTLAVGDYEVVYENNVEVGTATIIVNGKGDTYGGTIKKTFNITAKVIADSDFTIELIDKEYTGSVIEPTVTSTLAAEDYVVTYSNNVNVGTATIKVEGRGNYTGEFEKTFAITAKELTDADFDNIADQIYTGSAIEPKVKSTFIAGTDYDVVYANNVNVGTATVTITPKGNCKSDTPIVKTFNIKARVISDADFTIDNADKVYTGSAIEPEVTSALKAGTDYVVTYENNEEKGTATITITGKGPNCKGVISTTFKIVEKYASSGGGGGGVSTYAVTAPEVAGGKITASHKKASAGQTVTITVTPDEGYVLSTLVIVDKDGKEVAATKDGANYKFVMPAGTVEVKATFAEGTEDGFTDVKPGDYYYDSVNWAVDNGITNGMSANSFGSNFDCTRAQMVTFLWRAAGCPKPMTTESDFVDIVKGSYYYDAVLWAEENGITIGTSATTFSPDDNVTRGQTVTFFWRMENKPAAEVNVEFTDVVADAYYYDAVAWAVEEEITNGVSATSFAPNDMCKREQIVTFLYRYFVNR